MADEAGETVEEARRVIESLKAMESMEDPVARAAAISDVLKYVEERSGDWRTHRRDAVVGLRAEKVTYRKIASMIHTSLGTVQSLERGHAGAWGTKPRTKPDAEQGGPEGE